MVCVTSKARRPAKPSFEVGTGARSSGGGRGSGNMTSGYTGRGGMGYCGGLAMLHYGEMPVFLATRDHSSYLARKIAEFLCVNELLQSG